ncbi:MAG: UDP-glucose 4-epimerase GalE [Candidatus Sumerlaeia bacterium]|nr:UDP-glucose 4-epimerase GalE [Candidatus Sumerlaeia bacterium]
MPSVLVTGGAGYIGSVTVEALRRRGDTVIVLDNLATGHRGAVDERVVSVQGDIRRTAEVADLMERFDVESVIHFAAASLVSESVTNPRKYFENNVAGTLSLLAAMREAEVPHIVFSSTAAVYGEPKSTPITEDHPTNPANPYGRTKLMIEETLAAYAAAYDLGYVALRYFNAAGASGQFGEHHDPETHLIPVVLQVALGKRANVSVFGEDYDTPDGTCVRDYIHVEDLAAAHLGALNHLWAGGEPLTCNLGNGQGYSVKQVIDTCRKVTGHKIPAVRAPRRAGDPSRLVASSQLAREALGWRPRKPELETIVSDAWAWHQAHPHGYGKAAEDFARTG